MGVPIGQQEHFRGNVVACHKVFESNLRSSEFSFGVRHKEPSGRFICLEEDGLVFDNPPFRVFIASQADFVPMFVFSDAHRD